MNQIPILFLGDSPTMKGGLSRILRDLATFTSTLPEFRVGSLGRGGISSRKLPWMQYNFAPIDQWGESYIPGVWRDFAGDQPGVIFSVWDASRLYWFSCPDKIPDQGIRDFLLNPTWQRWGYFPVDAQGPGDRLSALGRETVQRYDRVLAYTQFGQRILSNSVGRPVDWIPHGYDSNVFFPRDGAGVRTGVGWSKGTKLIGCVMSNQARKDWGCVATVCNMLRHQDPSYRFWWHVDVMERSGQWSIPALLADLSLTDHVHVTLTGAMSDEQMSYWYSACDATVLISSEGYGYPSVESMACGTPALHSSYGGGAELVPAEWQVEPCSYRMEGLHNCVRPVFDPQAWVDAVIKVVADGKQAEKCAAMTEHLQWRNLWPAVWRKWMLEGLR